LRPGNPGGAPGIAAGDLADTAAGPCREGDIRADKYGFDPCGSVGGARLEDDKEERLEKVVSVERPGMEDVGGAAPRYPAL